MIGIMLYNLLCCRIVRQQRSLNFCSWRRESITRWSVAVEKFTSNDEMERDGSLL